ncbi:MAG: ATP-binding cassette domain-containing protein, partial [Rikenellaceae bacterium]
MENIIEIHNGVARQPQYILPQPIELSIARGEQVAMVGENGSGKSILVGVITGAIPLKDLGVRYNFGGDAPRSPSRNIKYLAFRDSYGAADRDYYHQRRWNSFDREDQQLVKEVLPRCEDPLLRDTLFEMLDINSMLDKELILLSSGELRKFQLTKALLSAPRVLILENPFIGLDAKTRELLHNLLREIVERCSLQVILVLSKSDDIPTFITHIIPVRHGVCQAKVTREEYSEEPLPSEVITHQVKQKILNLDTTPNRSGSELLVDLRNVSIRYGEYTILKDLSWSMQQLL